MKNTWQWTFENAQGKVSGTVEGVDLRDALSRILTQDTGGNRLFGQVHNVPVDVLQRAPGNNDPQLTIEQDGFRIGIRRLAEMYVVREGNLLVLRQQRFRAQLADGQEHPHDICALAHSVAEMHSMLDKHWPDADFSAVAGETEGETPQ